MSAATDAEVPRAERWSDSLNPMVVKEIRQALRGDTFYKGLWIVLLLSALASAFALSVVSRSLTGEQVGSGFFGTVYTCMCLALLGLTPMAAFQSLAGEWDDDSFDLLVASDLAPGQIVRGKLCSALVQGALIGVAFLPMLAVALTLPGLSLFAAAFAVGMLVTASVVATAVALATASVARRRPARIAATGFVVTLCLGLAGILIMASIDLTAGADFLLDDEVLAGVGAMVCAGFFVGGYALLVAQAQISHPEENKSTALRLWTVVALAVGAPVLGLLQLGAGASSNVLVVGSVMLLLLVSPALFVFATEERRLPRRVVHELRRGIATRLPDLLLPGSARGLLFALTCLFLYALGVGLFGEVTGEFADLAPTFRLAVVLAFNLALASLFVRALGRLDPVKHKRVAFILALVATGLVASLVGAALGDSRMASGQFLLNPIWVVADGGPLGPGLSGLFGGAPVYFLMLAVAVAANVPGIVAAVRERAQLARRDAQPSARG